MRKLLSLLLISLMLSSVISPAFGSGYPEKSLAYLKEKYGVSEEKIELYEGGMIELEFTAESFWFANYMISPEGKSALGFSKGEKPRLLPAPEPRQLPAPDTPTDDKIAILPLPPQDEINKDYIYDDNNIYGGIYIRIKTGEILEQDKMEAYFSAEWQLAEQEWKRLSKEAGKLDVSLYRKLQGLSPTEKVTVWIQPTPVETDEVRTLFAALKKKYPEHAKGMDLAEILSYGYGFVYDVPGIRGGGDTSSSGSSGYAVPGADAAVSYMVPEARVEANSTSEKPGAEIMLIRPNEEYWQEYNAFWEELEQIRVQAVIPSLASIKETLNGMGITYRDNGTSVAAELTVAQINDIAQLPAVATVFEEVIFTAMDGAESLLARSNAASEMKTMSIEADNNESTSSYWPLVLIALVVPAAFVIYRRRITPAS